MVCATPSVVPVAEKYTTSVLPATPDAAEDTAALDAASLEAAEDATDETTGALLTLDARPEHAVSSSAAVEAPATCKNLRREVLRFIIVPSFA